MGVSKITWRRRNDSNSCITKFLSQKRVADHEAGTLSSLHDLQREQKNEDYIFQAG